MNIQHLRYVVEVEKTRSLTQAAEKLNIGQSDLSDAIRKLEGVLNIEVFDRTANEIVPTSQGEEFLHYARSVLAQLDEMTAHYQQPQDHPQTLRLSVPRASYISQAFASFAQKADPRFELNYKETNALRAIRNVTEHGYELGIVRYQASYEKYFLSTFEEKGLNHRELWSFRYRALMRADHPIAAKPSVTLADLEDFVEIAHGDSYVPSLPSHKQASEHPATRRILVYERGSQFDLLCSLPKAYMWVSPVPESLLNRWGLVQPPCIDFTALHKDVLIYRKEYSLTPLDEQFLEEIEQVRKELPFRHRRTPYEQEEASAEEADATPEEPTIRIKPIDEEDDEDDEAIPNRLMPVPVPVPVSTEKLLISPKKYGKRIALWVAVIGLAAAGGMYMTGVADPLVTGLGVPTWSTVWAGMRGSPDTQASEGIPKEEIRKEVIPVVTTETSSELSEVQMPGDNNTRPAGQKSVSTFKTLEVRTAIAEELLMLGGASNVEKEK